MNELGIPILKKSFDLYKTFHDYRKIVPKNDRFTIYERTENLILDIVDSFLEAGFNYQANKTSILNQASVKLNKLRFLIRLMKESQTFDTKKYVALQTIIDDIGRQLGGWIRSDNSA